MTPTPPRSLAAIVLVVVTMASGCADDAVPAADASAVPEAVPATTVPASTVPTTVPATTVPVRGGQPAPDWLGSRVLAVPEGADIAAAQPTPAELIDRQLWTDDVLDPPAGAEFESSISSPPPSDVIARSTWTADCPNPLENLAYVRVSFVGFDGWFHTGELLVVADVAEEVVDVFAGLHQLRFPIEEMRVVRLDELDADPTGDGNNTTSFVCRPAVNSTSWSRHAHGAAIDINPFHNPYVKGATVIPELATAYLDRADLRPGMVTPEVVALFTEMGWTWGGTWSSASDYMHFSDNGR